MADATKQVSIILRMIDRITGPSRTIQKSLAAVERQASASSRAFRLAENMSAAAGQVEQTSRGLLNMFTAPLGKASELQRAINSVESVSFQGLDPEARAEAVARITEEIERLGASTKFTAAEVAAAAEVFGRRGITGGQQVAALAPTLLLSRTEKGLGLEQAAEVAGGSLTSFGLDATELGRVADVLAKVSASSATSVALFGDGLANLGPAAKSAGVDIETYAASIGALADANVRGSEAGTAMRNVISRLQAPSKTGQKELKKLGISALDEAGNMRPFIDVIEELGVKLAGVGSGQRQAVLKAIFEEQGAQSAAALLDRATIGNDQGQTLRMLTDELYNASGAAEEMANTLDKHGGDAMSKLSSATDGLMIAMGRGLIPMATDVTETVTEGVTWLNQFTTEHADLTRAVLIAAGVLGGLGVTVAIIMKTVSAGVAIWGFTAKAIAMVTTAMKILRAVTMTHPILAIITAIAIGAYLIYEHWDDLPAFFKAIWDEVVGIVDAAIEKITGSTMGITRAINEITGNTGGVAGGAAARAIEAGRNAEKQAEVGALPPEQRFASLGLTGMMGEQDADGGAGGAGYESFLAAFEKRVADQRDQRVNGAIEVKVSQDGRPAQVTTRAPPGIKMPVLTGAPG